MITIYYLGQLAELTRLSQEETEAETINDVLKYIKKSYGREAYKEAKRMMITINQVSIGLLNKTKSPLKSGDRVHFFPMSSGG